MSQALLALEDGTIFRGLPLGDNGHSVGEIVFNTAMTGYQEILTDPSYAEQIITFTSPHIGNVGCNQSDAEGPNIVAAGLVLREYHPSPSNWRSEIDLHRYCCEQKIVGITDIDTRSLTHIIRERGTLHACITQEHDAESAIKLAQSFSGLTGKNLADRVSTKTPYQWQEPLWQHEVTSSQLRVVVIDYGVKRNILRSLVSCGCEVWVVPASSSVEDILAYEPHGIVLSNGPGDPAACQQAIENAQSILEKNIPLLGICLGCQILALAIGAKTMKMKFGHHGSNHPIIDCRTNKVIISSQNHNFAIDEASLTSDIQITHRSLFDNTVQGFRYRNKPIIALQGHPEASPGPHELGSIFKEFVALLT